MLPMLLPRCRLRLRLQLRLRLRLQLRLLLWLRLRLRLWLLTDATDFPVRLRMALFRVACKNQTVADSHPPMLVLVTGL